MSSGDKDLSKFVMDASPWRLMWWRFRAHRVALFAALLLLTLYLLAMFAGFIAPYGLSERSTAVIHAPPQRLHFFSEEGIPVRPFVYGLVGSRHVETLRKFYTEDHRKRFPVELFTRGTRYHFLGLFETDLHLFGVSEGGTIHVLGTDALGRDMFSRILYGARISLTIGLIGVAISLFLGMFFGTISGYFGGWIDSLIQRGIEVIQAFPGIPLWMALAAAMPATWSPIQVYLGITVVLSVLGWTGLGRQVRGKILSLREEDFATAALIGGSSRWRIMWRHLLPLFTSHLIVMITLAVPGMILGETALSFLGLGLRPPVTSWGVLLKEAQNVQVVSHQPWLIAPVFFVIATVLAFNFVGDGLRDAADPHKR